MSEQTAPRAKPKRVKLDRTFVRKMRHQPPAEREIFWSADLDGFGLRAEPSGHLTYIVRYRAGRGRSAGQRQMTISARLDPSAARSEAKKILGLVAQGRDPLLERRQKVASATDTLQAICEEYLKRECGMKRDADGSARFSGKIRSASQKLDCFERLVYPRLGAKQITDVKRSDLIRAFDQIADENGVVMSDRTLAHLRRVFNWHATRSDDFKSPFVKGMARTKPKERAGKRVLADDEIRDIFTALAKGAKTIPECFARMQRMLFFAALRRDEAAKMHRSEVSHVSRDGFKGDVWTIPAARMKGKHDHAVPLTAEILAQIKPANADGGFVFSTTGGLRPFSGYSKAKRALDREIAALREREGRPPMTPWTMQRDVRRTSRTLLSRARVESDVAERVVAHAIPGVKGVYDKWDFLPQKLDALKRLAALIERIIDPPPANVLTLPDRHATGG